VGFRSNEILRCSRCDPFGSQYEGKFFDHSRGFDSSVWSSESGTGISHQLALCRIQKSVDCGPQPIDIVNANTNAEAVPFCKLRTDQLVVLARVLIGDEQGWYSGLHKIMVGVVSDRADAGIECSKVSTKWEYFDYSDSIIRSQRLLGHQPFRRDDLHVMFFMETLDQSPIGCVVSEVIA
jgi:hypothetical protein